MQKPYYRFESSPDSLIYEFDSVSNFKTIRKVIVYEPLQDDLYHLGFGDLTEEGKIDYRIVSANQDMDKVLMTVVQTMLLFFEKYPDKKLVFVGSTESRTRLYRSIISKFIDTVELYFEIVGFTANDKREPFRKNQDYQAFLIFPKHEKI
jgi:hypothetical protein